MQSEITCVLVLTSEDETFLRPVIFMNEAAFHSSGRRKNSPDEIV